MLTATDGGFRLRGLEAGQALRLVLRATGYQTTELAVDPLGQDEERAGLLVRMQPAGSLRVFALDLDGSALELGWVEARRTGAPEGALVETALHAGEARLEGLAPGSWEVRVRIAGRAGDEGQVEAEALVQPGVASELRLRF